ncbi:MAG: hypothetical protein ACLQIB_57240 [Isosphaeraceae bacterium]
MITRFSPRKAAVLLCGTAARAINAFLRNVASLSLSRLRAEIIGMNNGYAGLPRTAHRLESGELTLEWLISEIDTYGGVLGVGREGVVEDVVDLSKRIEARLSAQSHGDES